jgi:hypothetical protein
MNVTCDPNTTTAGQIFEVQPSVNCVSIRKYCAFKCGLMTLSVQLNLYSSFSSGV